MKTKILLSSRIEININSVYYKARELVSSYVLLDLESRIILSDIYNISISEWFILVRSNSFTFVLVQKFITLQC